MPTWYSKPQVDLLLAKLLPLWQPNTVYSSGALAVSPSGQIIAANSAFTSGGTYDATKWTVVTGGGGNLALVATSGSYTDLINAPSVTAATASDVPFSPASGLSSTNVQAAIAEAGGAIGGNASSITNLLSRVSTLEANAGITYNLTTESGLLLTTESGVFLVTQ